MKKEIFKKEDTRIDTVEDVGWKKGDEAEGFYNKDGYVVQVGGIVDISFTAILKIALGKYNELKVTGDIKCLPEGAKITKWPGGMGYTYLLYPYLKPTFKNRDEKEPKKTGLYLSVTHPDLYEIPDGAEWPIIMKVR